MEPKTIDALRWIVDIFRKHSIPYQISGGFAAKVYGSKRPLNDIDFEIPDRCLSVIFPLVSEYVVFGPRRFKDGKWDCELMTLNYRGQEIDISGADSMRMSNRKRTEWLSCGSSSLGGLDFNIAGVDVKLAPPREVADYKRELDGNHQLEDIEAIEGYIAANPNHK